MGSEMCIRDSPLSPASLLNTASGLIANLACGGFCNPNPANGALSNGSYVSGLGGRWSAVARVAIGIGLEAEGEEEVGEAVRLSATIGLRVSRRWGRCFDGEGDEGDAGICDGRDLVVDGELGVLGCPCDRLRLVCRTPGLLIPPCCCTCPPRASALSSCALPFQYLLNASNGFPGASAPASSSESGSVSSNTASVHNAES